MNRADKVLGPKQIQEASRSHISDQLKVQKDPLDGGGSPSAH